LLLLYEEVCDKGAGRAPLTGSAGDGVLGPLLNEEVCELLVSSDEEPRELTRGEEVPEEYACCGCGKGKEGNLSFTYRGR